MKTLHSYLVRQILAALLMTVAVFTFLLLIGEGLKNILPLLVNRQATLSLLAQAVGLLIPYVLVFALPMGLLTATLLVFGRFSADQELTAIRASGVSLVALATPVLLLSVAFSGICALMNMQFGPQCRIAYKKLVLEEGMARLGALLPERTFIPYGRSSFYVGKVDGTNLSDILYYELDSEGRVDSYIKASEGQLQVDRAQNLVQVLLIDAWRIGQVEGRRAPFYMESCQLPDIPLDAEPEKRARLSDLTIFQLWDELHELERRITLPPPARNLSKEEFREAVREVERSRKTLTAPILVEIHHKIAFSFACIGFALIGIPLGIRAHRRETTFGIAAALVLVMLYYSFFILAQALDTRPEYYPHLILWLPNFIFQSVGAVLLWRADRGE